MKGVKRERNWSSAGSYSRGERLAVECWCRRLIRWVPILDVQAGLTEPCGLRACRDQDRAERHRVKATVA